LEDESITPAIFSQIPHPITPQLSYPPPLSPPPPAAAVALGMLGLHLVGNLNTVQRHQGSLTWTNRKLSHLSHSRVDSVMEEASQLAQAQFFPPSPLSFRL
jgi:hypothetical protein